MSVKLAITGRPPVEFDKDHITLGSGPNCSISLPDLPHLKPNHAVIRLLDGRWVIEVRDAEALFIGGTQPKTAHWLNSGDVIHLTEKGPAVTFEIPADRPPAAAPKLSKKISDVILLPDSDPSIPTTDPASTSSKKGSDVARLPDSDPLIETPKPAPTAKNRTPKPPSSAIIQVPKSPSATKIPTAKTPTSVTIPKAPSSTTIRVPKSPSSSTIQTTKAPPSGVIRSTKSTSGSSPDKSPKSSSSIPVKGSRRPPSSTQIPVHDPDGTEPVAGLPVLKRLSSYEAPVISVDEDDLMSSFDESPSPRRRASQDADIEWIKMIVIRCFAVGLVFLILYITISELWKAYNPKDGSTSGPTALIDRTFSDFQRIL